MLDKEIQVVKAVEVEVSSIREKVQKGTIITLKDIDKLSNSVDSLITDYKATINDFFYSTSSVVKLENLLEVIGIVAYTSVGDKEVLDKTSNRLKEITEQLEIKI